MASTSARAQANIASGAAPTSSSASSVAAPSAVQSAPAASTAASSSGLTPYQQAVQFGPATGPGSASYIGTQLNPGSVNQPIPATSIGQVQPMAFPTPNTPTNYNSTLAAANGSVGVDQTGQPTGNADAVTGIPMSKSEMLLQKLMDMKPPSAEEAYLQSERDSGIIQARQQEQNFKNQIGAITAQANADQLAVTGQGRGVPEVIIGGQQAQIAKEAAIKLLPLQAQLAAAQGDVALAQSHLDTLFKIRSEDSKNDFDYKTKLITTAIDVADKQEARQLAALQHKEDQNFSQIQDANNYTQQLSLEALKAGDNAAMTQLTKLNLPQQGSKTFAKDLAAYNAKVSSIQSTMKRNPSTVLDDENKRLQNMKLAKEITLLGEPTAKEKKEAADKMLEAKMSIPIMRDKLAAVDALSDHSGLNSRVGTNILSRTPQDLSGVTGKAATLVGAFELPFDALDKITGAGQEFAGGVHQLVNGLTLQALIDAKARGATFGALSEGELSLLSSSATKINDWEIKDDKGKGTGVWNIDESSFKKELNNIKTLTNRAILLQEGTLVSPDEDALLNNVYTTQKQTLPAASYYSN